MYIVLFTYFSPKQNIYIYILLIKKEKKKLQGSALQQKEKKMKE